MKKSLAIVVLLMAPLILSALVSPPQINATTSNQTNTYTVTQIVPGGRMRWPLGWWPTILNILNPDTSAYDWEILGYIFDSLYITDPWHWTDTRYDHPLLAEKIERKIVTDPKWGRIAVWNITLRKNVTWHDGTPMTADDFIFTYEFAKWLTINMTLDNNFMDPFLYELVINVTKIDDYTFVVYVNSSGFLDSYIALITVAIPKHIWGSGKVWSELLGVNIEGDFPDWNVTVDIAQAMVNYEPKSPSDPILIGNGPFRLVAWEPAGAPPHLASRFLLRRYENYYFRALDAEGNIIWPWEKAQINETYIDLHGPYIDELEYIVVTDPVRLKDMLIRRELDMGSEFEFGFYVREFAEAGFTLLYTDRRGFGHLSLNSKGYLDPETGNYTHKWMRLSKFRRALAYAVDKRRICEEAWAGYAIPIDSPVPPSQGIWSAEELFPEHYYDSAPEKALALLESIGIRDIDDDGILENETTGEEIEITITATESPSVRAIVSRAAEDIRNLGIHVNERYMDFISLIYSWYTGAFDITFFGWSLGRFPYILMVFMSGYLYNRIIYRWSNATYDYYVALMLSAEDLDTAVEACHQAQIILYYEQPIIPIYQNRIVCAYDNRTWAGVYLYPGDGINNWWTLMKAARRAGLSAPPTLEGYNYEILPDFWVTLNVTLSDTEGLDPNNTYILVRGGWITEYTRVNLTLVEGDYKHGVWTVEEWIDVYPWFGLEEWSHYLEIIVIATDVTGAVASYALAPIELNLMIVSIDVYGTYVGETISVYAHVSSVWGDVGVTFYWKYADEANWRTPVEGELVKGSTVDGVWSFSFVAEKAGTVTIMVVASDATGETLTQTISVKILPKPASSWAETASIVGIIIAFIGIIIGAAGLSVARKRIAA